jgi:nitroreductase
VTDLATSATGAITRPTMGLEEAIFTTRAMRRLKSDPVPIEILSRIVEAATMAPTGSYQQNWRFIVVTERPKIERLAALWRQVTEMARDHAHQVLPEAIFKSVVYLGEHFGDTPAVVFVGGTDAPPPGAPVIMSTTWFGSIFPAAQNLMLAARAYGLGTTLTTIILGFEDELRTILELPPDVTLAACIPVGYPKGKFGRPPRNPVDQVAHLNRFGNPLPAPAVTFEPPTVP